MAALNKAISERRFKQARSFIDSGVNLNSRCKKGNTALIQLSFVEQEALAISMATRLLKRGAKIDATNNDGLSALSTAVLKQKENVVALFLKEAGSFDLNSKDKRGNTALLYAAEIGNLNILKSLVIALKRYQLSVDVANNDGFTPLMQACLNGNMDCANYLITEGNASLNIRDQKYRRTPVDWAETKGIPRRALLNTSKSLSTGFIEESRVNIEENKGEGKTSENSVTTRKTNGSYKVQFRQIYQAYECQLTASFKPGKKPKPKLLPPIQEEKSNAKGSPRSHLVKNRSTHRLIKRTSLEKAITHKTPQMKFQRSQSVTDLTKLDVHDSERLVRLSTSQRIRSARSGRVWKESAERQQTSRIAPVSSKPSVKTVAVERNE